MCCGEKLTQVQLDEKERLKLKKSRINKATMDEKNRKPNPQNSILFPEENFVEFTSLRGDQKLKLHTYRFCPPQEIAPKALLFQFHGLSSHMNDSAHIAKQFASIGCIVVGFDYRGHGKSEGLFGYFERLDHHFDDCNTYIEKVIKLYENQKLPVFLAGHSMGGMTAFRLSVQNPQKYKGVLLFAPALKTFTSIPLYKITRALAYCCPEYALVTVDQNIVSKNPKIQEDYLADPYMYRGKLRIGTGRTILTGIFESNPLIEKFTNPWILIQGGLDKIVDPDVMIDLEKRSPSTDKTVLYYENCWHDIWHEEEILDIMPKALLWIKDRY